MCAKYLTVSRSHNLDIVYSINNLSLPFNKQNIVVCLLNKVHYLKCCFIYLRHKRIKR